MYMNIINKSVWFWGETLGPWSLYGLWYKQKFFIGISINNDSGNLEIF